MAEIEAAVPVAVPETPEVAAESDVGAAAAAKGPHKLQRQWTFWYDIQTKPKPGAAWGTSLKKGYTFDTVEEFWWYVLALLLSLANPIRSDLAIEILCWFLYSVVIYLYDGDFGMENIKFYPTLRG